MSTGKQLNVPIHVIVALSILGIYCSYVEIKRDKDFHHIKLVHEKLMAERGGEALTQNGGKLTSVQQGNVHYFYQVDPANGTRIPLPDYKVMLNAFDSTARLSGPVVSISPEIIPYNGRLAYMGMWVTFMPRTLPESLPR